MKKMHKKNQRGMTIIEVLVAITLLAIGFIAMLTLQSKSLMYSRTAYYQGIASQIASGLQASIRANPDAISSYVFTNAYDPESVISVNCVGIGPKCTASDLAKSDVAWARQSAREQLAGGDLYINQSSDPTLGRIDIVLIWEQPAMSTNANEPSFPCTGIAGINVSLGNNPQCMPFSVRIPK